MKVDKNMALKLNLNETKLEAAVVQRSCVIYDVDLEDSILQRVIIVIS